MASPDVGLQFHLPSHKGLGLLRLLELAKMAESGGVKQVWVTDNLQNRNIFVTLAALAGATDLKLGTAIMVHYFRNPVDAVDSVAAVTELMGGSEISLGIGRGNIRTSNSIKTPAPLGMMRETAQALSILFAGQELVASDFPTLSSYFNYADTARFQLSFSPARDVRIYCGGDGPKTLAIGGAHMDGLLCGTTFRPIARMGRLPSLLKIFDDAADEAGKTGPRRRVAEIKIALDSDPQVSREFARHGVGSRVLGLRWRGYPPEDIARLGITQEQIDRLEDVKRTSGDGTSQALAPLVTDEMIDAFYVAGDLGYCRDQIDELLELADQYGFHQIIFSGISADFEHGVRLLIDEIMPSFS